MNEELDTMQQKIARKEQDTLKQIQDELNRIAKLYPTVTQQDRGFVRARVDYLNDKHRKVFAEILKPDNTEEVSYRDLQVKAKELGINSSGVKREELEKLVAQAVNN